MAQLSITVPDAQVARVRDAFALAYGYQATINGSPNPESKAAFTLRKVREYIVSVVRGVEAQAAAEAARVSAAEAVDSQITLS